MMPCPLLFLSLLSLVATLDVIDVQLDESELDGADRWEFLFLPRTIQILQLARHFCCGLVQGKCAGVRRFWELKIWDFGERKDLFSGLCWTWVQPQVPGQLWALQHKVSLELDRMRFFPRCGPYQCSSVTNACSSSSSTPTTTVIFQILDQMAMFWILINLFCWGLWIGHSYIGWRQSTRKQPCGEISRAFERFCLDMIPLKSRFCIIIRFGHDWLTLLVMPGLEYWRPRTATRRKAENTILRCFPVGEHKIPIGYQCRLKYTGVVQFGEYVQEGDLAAAADPDVVARCEKILKKCLKYSFRINTLGGVFIGGGEPDRLLACLFRWIAPGGQLRFEGKPLRREEGGKRVDTPVLAALRSLLARGGLIGATRCLLYLLLYFRLQRRDWGSPKWSCHPWWFKLECLGPWSPNF